MMPSRWSVVAMTVFALGSLSVPALAQLCFVDPISPLCCPSPCPVFDPVRVPKLLADVDSLRQALTNGTQLVQSATQVGQTIGDAKAVADTMSRSLSSFTGTLSGEVTTFQNGLSTHPVQALASIKQALFEPVGAGSTSTQLASRAAARLSAAQGEQLGALATSLMRSNALPALAPQQSLLAGTTSSTQQLQSDMAVNAASRLALYQDAGALHQLAAAWLSQRSMQAAVKHPGGTGEATVSTASSTGLSDVSGLPSTTQSSASALDQLVTLHDARVTAQTVLSAYPALQQIVAGAQLASQFASSAESDLRQSLSRVGLPASSLADVEKGLTSADHTDWLDEDKTATAQQAAAQLSLLLSAGGALSPAGSDQGATALQQMRTAMTAWLDASKQSRYWEGLANQAQQSMATLDSTLGSLSDSAGVDVTGAAAAAQEKRLLSRLSLDPSAAQWKAVLAAAAQDSPAHTLLSTAGTP